MSRGLPWAVAVVGLVLVAGGIGLFVLGNQPADFGWTAYGPDLMASDAYESRLQLTFIDGPAVLWTRTSALGAGLALFGLLVLAALTGWVVGRRSSGDSTG
jgi:hypothetical protein